jgi:hypothetical protein
MSPAVSRRAVVARLTRRSRPEPGVGRRTLNMVMRKGVRKEELVRRNK